MREISNCHSKVRQKHHDREQVSGRRSSRRRNRLLNDIHEGDRRRRRGKHLAHGEAEHPAAHPRNGPVRAQPHPLVGNQPRDHRGGALQALADRPQPHRSHRHHPPARVLRPLRQGRPPAPKRHPVARRPRHRADPPLRQRTHPRALRKASRRHPRHLQDGLGQGTRTRDLR